MELYCPAPLSFSLKILMAHAIVKNFAIFFFDVSRAFLCTPIRELACAEVPKEYMYLPDDSDWAFKLKETAHGLNDTMVDFDVHFENVATGQEEKSKMKSQRFLSDPCSFADKDNMVAMSKHVDDGASVGPREKAQASLKELGSHLCLEIPDLVSVALTTRFWDVAGSAPPRVYKGGCGRLS